MIEDFQHELSSEYLALHLPQILYWGRNYTLWLLSQTWNISVKLRAEARPLGKFKKIILRYYNLQSRIPGIYCSSIDLTTSDKFPPSMSPGSFPPLHHIFLTHPGLQSHLQGWKQWQDFFDLVFSTPHLLMSFMYSSVRPSDRNASVTMICPDHSRMAVM